MKTHSIYLVALSSLILPLTLQAQPKDEMRLMLENKKNGQKKKD